jgi:hypothetical protein
MTVQKTLVFLTQSSTPISTPATLIPGLHHLWTPSSLSNIQIPVILEFRDLLDLPPCRSANAKALAMLKKISPVAWQYIHFLGHYAFLDNHDQIDLNSLLANVSLL